MFDSLNISASALATQRVRMDTIANNMANADTTRSADGKKVPFRRRFVVLAPGREGEPGSGGVHVEGVKQDMSPFRLVHDPGHPDADARGMVLMPNIEPTVEMVNAMEASRAYEANVTAMEVSKAMINATLRLLA
jgi:flagellar basal-body rod protein FlgC